MSAPRESHPELRRKRVPHTIVSPKGRGLARIGIHAVTRKEPARIREELNETRVATAQGSK